MAHHKRKRPKHRRAGCLLCKPGKLTANKTAERMRSRRLWERDWAPPAAQDPVRREG